MSTRSTAPKKSFKLTRYIPMSVWSLGSLVLFWVLLAWGMNVYYNNNVFPTPLATWNSFIELLQWPTDKHDPYFMVSGVDEPKKHWYTLGLLGPHVWRSFLEVLAGFSIALVVSLILGFLAGFNRSFREYITPLNQVFMSIPAIAWAPIMILIFSGYKFIAIVMVVYIAAVSPMILNIMEGVLTIKGGEVRAARALGANARQLFLFVYLPASLPFITAGMRIGFSQAWRALVAAEMVGATGLGVGHMVSMANQNGHAANMMVGIVFIGLLSFMFERLVFRRIEKRYEVWRLN